jgi:hypothetical protein
MDCKSSYEPGRSCKRESLPCVEYVPCVCIYRPSLLPIESFGEISGGELCDASCIAVAIAEVTQRTFKFAIIVISMYLYVDLTF